MRSREHCKICNRRLDKKADKRHINKKFEWMYVEEFKRVHQHTPEDFFCKKHQSSEERHYDPNYKEWLKNKQHPIVTREATRATNVSVDDGALHEIANIDAEISVDEMLVEEARVELMDLADDYEMSNDDNESTMDYDISDTSSLNGFIVESDVSENQAREANDLFGNAEYWVMRMEEVYKEAKDNEFELTPTTTTFTDIRATSQYIETVVDWIHEQLLLKKIITPPCNATVTLQQLLAYLLNESKSSEFSVVSVPCSLIEPIFVLANKNRVCNSTQLICEILELADRYAKLIKRKNKVITGFEELREIFLGFEETHRENLCGLDTSAFISTTDFQNLVRRFPLTTAHMLLDLENYLRVLHGCDLGKELHPTTDVSLRQTEHFTIQDVPEVFGLHSYQVAANILVKNTLYTPKDCNISPRNVRSSEKLISSISEVIASEPGFRVAIRRLFLQHAVIDCKILQSLPFIFPINAFENVKAKKFKDFSDKEFTELFMAEKNGDLSIQITSGVCIADIVKVYFLDSQYPHVNEMRGKCIEKAVQVYFAELVKEFKCRKSEDAIENATQQCALALQKFINVAPFTTAVSDEKVVEYDDKIGVRVFSMSYCTDSKELWASCINKAGERQGKCIHVMLNVLLQNPGNDTERQHRKNAENLVIETEMRRFRPHVVTISGKSYEAVKLRKSIKALISKISKDDVWFSNVMIEIVPVLFARVFASSQVLEKDIANEPSLVREARSIARLLQNPLLEICQLFNSEAEILLVPFIPTQDLIQQKHLRRRLQLIILAQIVSTGIDLGLVISCPRWAHLFNFVRRMRNDVRHDLTFTIRERISVNALDMLWEQDLQSYRPFCRFGESLPTDNRTSYISPRAEEYCQMLTDRSLHFHTLQSYSAQFCSEVRRPVVIEEIKTGDEVLEHKCKYCKQRGSEEEIKGHFAKCTRMTSGIRVFIEETNFMGFIPRSLMLTSLDEFKECKDRAIRVQVLSFSEKHLNFVLCEVEESRMSKINTFEVSEQVQNELSVDCLFQAVPVTTHKRLVYLERVSDHPNFLNISHTSARQHLEGKKIGDFLFHPSYKNVNMLTGSWKVCTGVVHTFDINEKDKPDIGSIGKTLYVDGVQYDSLAHIETAYIKQMTDHLRPLLADPGCTKKPFDGNYVQIKNFFKTILDDPQRIPRYVIQLSKNWPRTFLFAFIYERHVVWNSVKLEPCGLVFKKNAFSDVKHLYEGIKRYHSRSKPHRIENLDLMM